MDYQLDVGLGGKLATRKGIDKKLHIADPAASLSL